MPCSYMHGPQFPRNAEFWAKLWNLPMEFKDPLILPGLYLASVMQCLGLQLYDLNYGTIQIILLSYLLIYPFPRNFSVFLWNFAEYPHWPEIRGQIPYILVGFRRLYKIDYYT